MNYFDENILIEYSVVDLFYFEYNSRHSGIFYLSRNIPNPFHGIFILLNFACVSVPNRNKQKKIMKFTDNFSFSVKFLDS